eukprot:TRINITY_DN9061_c0_g2_i1.p1 TRINITY_DN9061_c0_g2~~TRINITY_DN9061_c0_g2_i1.p1  ORF type:complete len:603 (+),score=80.89 TRINITY_DN9061_c0_g2_i1:94-1902(+)
MRSVPSADACPPLISMSDDEDQGGEVVLGELAVKINAYEAEVGAVDGNLKVILGVAAARWDGRRFVGLPGEGIVEAIEAFFEKKDSWAPPPNPPHPGFGENPVLMDKITRHLLQRQRIDRPSPDALTRRQTQLVLPEYRLMLVDWMVETTVGYRLKPQTIHRAVIYVDRVLSTIKETIPETRIQLIGSTCLVLACKMEEVDQESAICIMSGTSQIYSPQMMETMEQQITELLECRFSDVTINDFELIYTQMLGLQDEPCLRLSRVLSEVALHSLPLVVSVPSLVAMAVIYIAVHLTQGDFENYWAPWMREYFPHTPEELQECVDSLLTLWEGYRSETLGSKLKYVLNRDVEGVCGGEVPRVRTECEGEEKQDAESAEEGLSCATLLEKEDHRLPDTESSSTFLENIIDDIHEVPDEDPAHDTASNLSCKTLIETDCLPPDDEELFDGLLSSTVEDRHGLQGGPHTKYNLQGGPSTDFADMPALVSPVQLHGGPAGTAYQLQGGPSTVPDLESMPKLVEGPSHQHQTTSSLFKLQGGPWTANRHVASEASLMGLKGHVQGAVGSQRYENQGIPMGDTQVWAWLNNWQDDYQLQGGPRGHPHRE